jgi:uncharacterized membrane protein YbhN (UPF0104 family)
MAGGRPKDRPRLAARLAGVLRRRRVLAALQLLAAAAVVGFLAYAVRGSWDDALPRLRDANPLDLVLACAVLAAYYLLFVLGWLWILAALRVRTTYRVALQAEMISMLAKYVPGGVWTPAARVVAMRRAGIVDTPVILASIGLEAALSAVSGIVVFVIGLGWVGDVDAPLVPLLLLAGLLVVLLHPRVFGPLASRLFRVFGSSVVPALPLPTMLGLLVFYASSWLVGGAALFLLVRSVGGEPDVTAIPFLGGTAAVGAIVSVLTVFAPSGLGVREASMYGLLLAVVSDGVALGATVLNRLAITLVEALLLAGAAASRLRR